MIEKAVWEKMSQSGDGSVEVRVPGLEGNGRGSLIAVL